MGSINEKIVRWSENDENSKYIILNDLLDYLGENLFFDYEPSSGPYHDFTSRLNSWIENVSDDEDQKLLFQLVEKIFYVGREEFKALNRSAFKSTIQRWLIDQLSIKVDNLDFNLLLVDAINSTWFCPITDSFRINQFYHINQITSKHTFRPDWRSLKKFGSEEKIKTYFLCNNVKYVVLLEDFVGTGGQVLPSLKYACELDKGIKVLFVPLILCPQGFDNITAKMVAYENFSLLPVIQLKEDDLMNKDTVIRLGSTHTTDLIERVFEQVKGDLEPDRVKDLGPYGYKNTGSLTIMFSNAPNNSLSPILIESNTWTALFKRHSRD